MAVTTKDRGPVVAGARPVAGSASLILLRWGVLTAAALPAWIAGRVAAEGAARVPHLTAGDAPLPLGPLAALLRELAAPATAPALVLDQVLTAGALSFFDPARAPDLSRGFRRRVWRDGLARFWAFVRLVGQGLLASAAAAGLVRAATNALRRRGERAEWTAWSLELALPLASLAATALPVAAVLAIVFWAKVVTVADGRVRTRRSMLIACRLVARRPFAALGFFVGVSTVASALPALALWAWRRSPPGGPAGAWARAALVGAATLAAAFLWHWTVRTGRLVYADTRLDDLRAQPDAPFGWTARIRGILPRRAGAARPPAA